MPNFTSQATFIIARQDPTFILREIMRANSERIHILSLYCSDRADEYAALLNGLIAPHCPARYPRQRCSGAA